MAKLPPPASNSTAPLRPLSTLVAAPRNSALAPCGEITSGMRFFVAVRTPPNRLRAEAQGGGTPDHLDLVRDQRIDRHEMILAEIRGAIGADAVLLHADAVDVA